MAVPDFDFITKSIDKVKTVFWLILKKTIELYKSIPVEVRQLIMFALFAIGILFVLWAIKHRNAWKRRKIY